MTLSGRSTPSVAQIKQWYHEVSLLLNRLERCGEEFTLTDDGTSKEIRGLTSRVYKNSPDTRGTWSKE